MVTTYLVLANLAVALARSQDQATAMGCDGTTTKYWWPVQQLTDGTAALVIQQATAFDVTATTKVVKTATGLTAQEQATLVSAAAIAPLLPVATVIGGVQVQDTKK